MTSSYPKADTIQETLTPDEQTTVARIRTEMGDAEWGNAVSLLCAQYARRFLMADVTLLAQTSPDVLAALRTAAQDVLSASPVNAIL